MAAVTPGLEPFLLQRGRVGCRLVHGFLGTPWEMLELYIFDRISSADKRLVWLERGGHVVTVDYDKAIVFDEIYHFIAQHAGL